jgi:hypothetical protein
LQDPDDLDLVPSPSGLFITVKGVRATWIVAAVAAVLLSLALPAAAQQATPTGVPVKVPVTARFTDSGLTVKPGDTITIHAGGTITFQGGKATRRTTGPEGIPAGPQCKQIAHQTKGPFPEPQFACYSLIGRIGANGKPFEVGKRTTYRVLKNGTLWLGINDNYLRDNTGRWLATVSGASGKGNLAAPAPKSSRSKSSLMRIILMVLGVLVAALLVGWVIARRRKPAAKPGAAATKKAAPKAKPKPIPATEAVVGAAALRRTADERAAVAPIDPESSDVNIFKVELLDPGSFQVGYNFFPEGTTVSWRVGTNGTAIAAGEFVTSGGGSLQHYETVPLGTAIDKAGEVDVSFSWSIRDVPFSYSVRRSWQH